MVVEPLGLPRVVQAERTADRIVAQVHAERALGGLAADPSSRRCVSLAPAGPALLELLELVAVLRVVQEVGEVVKELHAVALHVRR